ncbi:MAG: FkbM family methyltransferase, partial [Roseobacter sp.]|nr:FkbM family methyltransferase [Roseobacter sp.]
MKRQLVGTAPGRLLQKASHWLELRSIPFRNPEQAALIGNKILAHNLVVALCPSGGTFVDVGAHLGAVFSSARHKDASLKIIAYEADPEKARHLQHKFRYCTVHAAAVGETPGTVQFYRDHQQTAYSSLVQLDNRDQTASEVPGVTLDQTLGAEKPDVLKIDIEGAELGALVGGVAVIRAHTPTILFESAHMDENSLGYSPRALWDWLSAEGYGIFYPDRLAHTAPALALDVFLDAHAHPRRCVDFFAVHQNKRAAVQARARAIL